MFKKSIAAVAAFGISALSFADISITGAYEGEFSNGGSGAYEYTQDLDLVVRGRQGESTVTVTLEDLGKDANDSTVSTNQVWIDTKLAGLDVMAGKKKGQNGNGLLQKASAASQKFSVSTNVGGAGVKATQASGDGNAKLDASFDLAGVAVKAQNVTNDARFISLGYSTNGIDVAYETNEASVGKTNTAYSVGGKVGPVGVTYVNIDIEDAAGVTQDDGILGDISDAVAGKDLNGVVGTLDVAEVGTVTGKYINKNDLTTMVAKLSRDIWEVSASKTENADTTFGAKMTVTF